MVRYGIFDILIFPTRPVVRLTPLDSLATTDSGNVLTWNVLQCNPGEYCCRASTDSTNCCSNTTAILTTTLGTLLVSTTATSTSMTGAVTVTVTSSTTAGITGGGNYTDPAADCPKDNSAVIGGAVGGALGVALLASLGALGFLVKRRKGWASSSSAPAYPAPVSYENTKSLPSS